MSRCDEHQGTGSVNVSARRVSTHAEAEAVTSDVTAPDGAESPCFPETQRPSTQQRKQCTCNVDAQSWLRGCQDER